MKTGINYSFFRLNPVLIPLYKVCEVVYFAYLHKRKLYTLPKGTVVVYDVPVFRMVPRKKPLYTKSVCRDGKLRFHYTGGLVNFFIISAAYFKHKVLNVFGESSVNPFDSIYSCILYDTEFDAFGLDGILFKGIVALGQNKIWIARRAFPETSSYHYKEEDMELFNDFDNIDTASSFIRTAGSLPAWGARQILGLRVKAAAGMALTSFLPAAVLFFNQTQFVQKAATAVLLGGSSWPFCRLGLFGPFTSPVGGLFSFNRNTL